MALTKGVNSYVSLTDAETYFEDRLDAAAWIEASEELRSQALVTATGILDAKEWVGVAFSASQSLSFPRNAHYFAPRLGQNVTLRGETPVEISKATFELAYHLLNNDGLLDNTGSIDNLNLGPISLQGIKAASVIPDTVQRMIRPLLFNAGRNAWWRAN